MCSGVCAVRWGGYGVCTGEAHALPPQRCSCNLLTPRQRRGRPKSLRRPALTFHKGASPASHTHWRPSHTSRRTALLPALAMYAQLPQLCTTVHCTNDSHRAGCAPPCSSSPHLSGTLSCSRMAWCTTSSPLVRLAAASTNRDISCRSMEPAARA